MPASSHETMIGVEEWRRRAKRRLPKFAFDYVDGGADDERALERNRKSLQNMVIRPRRLVSTATCDIRTEILGVPFDAPLVVAPLGLCGLIWPSGDLCLARAAALSNIPYTLSTASTTPLSKVAQATAGDKWFQLYVFGSRAATEHLLEDARGAGYRVLVVTVDVPINGNRRRDQRNGFVAPFNLNSRIAFQSLLCPRWMVGILHEGIPALANVNLRDSNALATRNMDRSLTWGSIQWLRDHWRGPILIKGILTADDASRACDHGVDGIVVSNHGGRQLDALPSPIDVLSEVTTAVKGRIQVLVDSGFRTGSDVVAALALGANAVMIGRPLLYGLAAAGEAGAVNVLRGLRSEIENTLTLTGFSALNELRSADIMHNID